jgi:hypothetical protein
MLYQSTDIHAFSVFEKYLETYKKNTQLVCDKTKQQFVLLNWQNRNKEFLVINFISAVKIKKYVLIFLLTFRSYF